MIPDCACMPIQVEAAAAGARAANGPAASSAAAGDATGFAEVAAYFKERQAREEGKAGEAGEGRSADADEAEDDEPSKVCHPLALTLARSVQPLSWVLRLACMSGKERLNQLGAGR